jgi:hypothetical protein
MHLKLAYNQENPSPDPYINLSFFIDFGIVCHKPYNKLLLHKHSIQNFTQLFLPIIFLKQFELSTVYLCLTLLPLSLALHFFFFIAIASFSSFYDNEYHFT